MLVRLVAAVSVPDIALLLVLAGILLIYAEFNRPGTIVLACLGTLSFTLGLYGLALLPLSHACVAAATVGLVLILIELKFPSRLMIATVGTAILAVALARLTRGVHVATALAISAIFTVVTLYLGRVALQARRNKQIRVRSTR